MKNTPKNITVKARESFSSKAGYTVYKDEAYWQLDKNNKVAVGVVWELLDGDAGAGFINTLAFYAANLSAAYTNTLCRSFLRMLQLTDETRIAESMLINYRAILNRQTEWHMGLIRIFLKKWYELGYEGVSEEIIEMLNSWTIKGAIKGDVVKRLDPYQGPLSDIELLGFNEGAVQAYEENKISITDLALGLIISSTGRRPIQISHLKMKDVLIGKNKRGEQCYLVNIPRAKQRQATFRQFFKQFAITNELWVILNAQASITKENIHKLLRFEIQDQAELPLFPDLNAFAKVKSLIELRVLLQSDRLHIKADDVTKQIKLSAKMADLHSERTGNLLNVTSRRFRYTTGTRASREGCGSMVIAELLDHSDNQNASIYVENIPDHVAKLDQAVGHQLAPYAQAFAGVLLDTEKDAHRGNDLNSRIKSNGKEMGTCGNYGFCGANVPIPCYTCIYFQPWLDGPHQVIYEELVAERERLSDVTGDIEIAAVNDRSILAVANVIQLCAKRREELANG